MTRNYRFLLTKKRTKNQDISQICLEFDDKKLQIFAYKKRPKNQDIPQICLEFNNKKLKIFAYKKNKKSRNFSNLLRI